MATVHLENWVANLAPYTRMPQDRRARCQPHGFVDGNKRAAFMGAYVFLGLNGQDLEAAEPDVATTMEYVASGRLTESGLASWIREKSRPVDR